MASAQPKKLLFLGDSFTVGTGLTDPRQAFPFRMAEALKAAEPKLYAIDGHTTKHLLGLLDFAEPLSNPQHSSHCAAAGDYDLVVLSIGANDLFRGHTLADYKYHFGELVQRAVWFAGNQPSRVIVLSVPAWDATPSIHGGDGRAFRAAKYEEVRLNAAADAAYNTCRRIATGVDTFNAKAHEIAMRSGVAFVDITDFTRAGVLAGGKPDASFFLADGIHYSGKMYAKWADRLLPVARKALSAP